MARPSVNPLVRFWKSHTGSTECWLWNGACNSHGYPKIWIEGKVRSAHRVAYEWFVGAIPEGYTIDHTCKVKRCVNPDHLEAVTTGENLRRYWVDPQPGKHKGRPPRSSTGPSLG